MYDIAAVVDTGLGNTSWLVDLGDGSALVVDPSRDPRPYLSEARRRSLQLRYAVETHLHADFISGARELASEADSEVVLPFAASAEFPHRAVGDEEEIDLGGLSLRVLGTPGHSPEHVSYLLVEGETPVALFSGGALIVGGVARPDLVSDEMTEPMARAAWQSVSRLAGLPESLAVYPTHGAGSFCSAGTGGERQTTIGQERLANPLLAAKGEDEFVTRLLGSLGSYPPYFRKLRAVNRRGPRVLGIETPSLPLLGPEDVDRHLQADTELIDVRPIAAYASGHIPGSLSIELRPKFASWLGWTIDELDTPLLFVIDPDQDQDDLVRQCLKIGYEHLVGLVEGDVETWARSGRPTVSTPLVDNPAPDRTVLDVRQESEWKAGHVPDAVHIELGSLAADAHLAPDGDLVAHCGHGQRAMTAASVLERHGRDDVIVFSGSASRWNAALESAGT